MSVLKRESGILKPLDQKKMSIENSFSLLSLKKKNSGKTFIQLSHDMITKNIYKRNETSDFLLYYHIPVVFFLPQKYKVTRNT